MPLALSPRHTAALSSWRSHSRAWGSTHIFCIVPYPHSSSHIFSHIHTLLSTRGLRTACPALPLSLAPTSTSQEDSRPALPPPRPPSPPHLTSQPTDCPSLQSEHAHTRAPALVTRSWPPTCMCMPMPACMPRATCRSMRTRASASMSARLYAPHPLPQVASASAAMSDLFDSDTWKLPDARLTPLITHEAARRKDGVSCLHPHPHPHPTPGPHLILTPHRNPET